MTTPNSRALPTSALVLSIIGAALLLLFFATNVGGGALIGAAAAGLVGTLLGALSLKNKSARGMSITAIVLGAIELVVALGLVVFALIFVGAIG